MLYLTIKKEKFVDIKKIIRKPKMSNFGAWNDVSKSTIVNCWNHANIIETKDTEEIVN